MGDTIESKEKEFVTGMPKSGCSWKKLSKKSSGTSKDKGLHKSWKEKAKIKQLNDKRKEKIKMYEQKEEKVRQDIFKSIKERKKQKEFNQFNTQRMEIIKDSRKIKKWNKKAREQLVKVPAEVFEKLVHKHTLKRL